MIKDDAILESGSYVSIKDYNRQGKNWYEVGALLRDNFRSLLKRIRFTSGNLEWEEDKGFFESSFYVKGEIKILEKLNKIVEGWNEK